MEEEAADESPPAAEEPRKGRYSAVQSWISTIVSLVALGLSAWSISLTREEPEVEMYLPHVLRVGQKDNAFVFIQPTIAARNKTQDVEIITSVQLEMRPGRPADRSRRPQFWWDEVITWKGPLRAGYTRVGDPAPLVVRQENPHQPVLSFVAEKWNFAPDTYQGTLTLNREKGRKPYVAKFCLTVTDDDLKEWKKQADASWWYPYRDDDPDRPKEKRDCYSRWSGY